MELKMSRSETKKKQEEIFKKRRKTVKDGKIVENKQFTINKDGKKVLKKRSIVDDLGKVLPFLPAGRIAGVASKVPGVKSGINKLIGSAKNFLKGDKKPKKLSVTGGGSSGTKGQGSGKFITQRKNRPTGTQITKPKNTQVKKPSTSLVNRTNRRFSPNRGPQQLANRAVVTGGLSELIKPKKSIAKPVENKKPKKDFGLGKPDEIKKPSAKQGPPRGPLKAKPVKKKSRSNISNSSSYDADFTRKNLEKRGLKAKNFMSPKNFASTTKEKERKIGIAGNFNTGGKMKKMTSGGSLKSIPPESKGLQALKRERPDVVKKMGFMKGGGKVVKMRGGGAATKGMNFNRGY